MHRKSGLDKPTLSCCMGKQKREQVNREVSKIEERVLEFSDALAEKMNFSVVGAEYKKEDGERHLRVYIDKDGGVDLDDCEKFSRALEEIIDGEDLIDEAYSLEVSSPGVDRKLTTGREFLHYIGRRVEAKLYKEVCGRKEFDGILKGYDGEHVRIDDGGETVEINPSEAVYIRLYFEF